MSRPADEERVLLLLTRDRRERGDQLDLVYWAAGPEGPARLVFRGQEAVFFVPRDVDVQDGRRRSVDLATLEGHPVDAVYFPTESRLYRERDRLRATGRWPHEADVRAADRFLMERFLTAGCTVRGTLQQADGYVELVDPQITASDTAYVPSVLSFDVESEGLDGRLLSIAVAGVGGDRVWIVAPPIPPTHATPLDTEAAVLLAFLDHVHDADPDIIVGWNVVDFDLTYLQTRCALAGIPFALGRGRRRARILPGRDRTQPALARVPGRVVMDGIATLRAATFTFESFSLESVSQELLGRGKAIDDTGDPVAEILRLHREDPDALATYNLEDARLVLDIFDAADLLGFALERQRLTGLTLDRRAGAIASFDHLYLPRLHRQGFVAPDTGASGLTPTSPGGYVMDSQPGLYDNVLVFDFKSLYPSLIRTFRVDPLGLAVAGEDAIPGYDGGRFDRDRHILPTLIETLWSARDDAKRHQNKPLSRAIKILMNSFYGVLGTPACRFFDPRLASSITRRGHEVLRQTRTFIESRGLPVIYGDTDSLFVLLGGGRSAEECRALGVELAAAVNTHWTEWLRRELQLDSAMELQFETHYVRFLMPTMRHSDQGTKKRYAGLVLDPSGTARLVFKGLEVVRTDWTPLARTFQRELVRRVFMGEPFEDYVRQVSDDLFAGRLDDQLVYRKRLRRAPEDYTKSAPPHVVAARKLARPSRIVHYVITHRGPEPVGATTSPLDYGHYLESQLEPAASVVLPFVGTSFGKLGGRQGVLF